jgi:hypothetical protein
MASMSKVKTLENQKIEEPSAEMVLPDFVTPAEAQRKKWAEFGCDSAYFVLEFLRGRRRLEIQPEEIAQTQLYLRSSELERRALDLVCESENKSHPSPVDERELQTRDTFLMDFIDGRNVGHTKWVSDIQDIPAKVAERKRFDRAYFRTVYTSRKLFGWIWGHKQ